MEAKLIEDNKVLFSSIMADLEKAEKYIYIEMYRIVDDTVGKELSKLLVEKCKQGVEVKVLVDAYGSVQYYIPAQKIIKSGGEVRFFRKLKFFFFKTFLKNQSRNHRKIVLIDDKIVYFGSSNLTSYSSEWRELNVRLKDPFAATFKNIFLKSYALHKKYDIDTFERIKPIVYKNFRIIQDAPSSYFQHIRNHFLYLIRRAKKEVIIETPYFLPNHALRKALINAVKKRNVKVKILVPQYSDVHSLDILRNKYLGRLHGYGIEILLYTPNNLHAKSILIDNKRFSIGSANFDYRSFRYQFEIMVSGTDQNIASLLREHLKDTEKNCIPFNHEEYEHRGFATRFAETILFPIRKFF